MPGPSVFSAAHLRLDLPSLRARDRSGHIAAHQEDAPGLSLHNTTPWTRHFVSLDAIFEAALRKRSGVAGVREGPNTQTHGVVELRAATNFEIITGTWLELRGSDMAIGGKTRWGAFKRED